MKPLGKREEKHLRFFGARREASSSDRHERKSPTGQALGNASFAVSRRQAGRTGEPGGAGSVCWLPPGGQNRQQSPGPAACRHRHWAPPQNGNKSNCLRMTAPTFAREGQYIFAFSSWEFAFTVV